MLPEIFDFNAIGDALYFKLNAKRSSQHWTWPSDRDPLEFTITPTSKALKVVALKLSISASISDERVVDAEGKDDIAIWEISSSGIGTSEMRNTADLATFRQTVGKTFDAIEDQHGMDVQILVFPAIPAACAVEFGRTWQPKAHPGFMIYDQIPGVGFIDRHEISSV